MQMDHVVSGSVNQILPFFIALIREIALLGWPDHWICRVLSSIPRRHSSEFIAKLRGMGNLIKNSRLTILDLFSTQYLLSISHACPQAKVGITAEFPSLANAQQP